MNWIYRVQQHLAITRRECLALLVLLGLLLMGTVVLYVQKQPRALPADAQAEADSLFAEGTAALRAPSPSDPDPPSDPEVPLPGAVRQDDRPASVEQEPPPRQPPQQRTGAQRLDLNTATNAQLQELPGIGPTLAQRILDYRSTYGPFRHVQDLQNVHGIGPKTVQTVAPLVAVSAREEEE